MEREHNAASLRSALEHVCAHESRTILMFRIDVTEARGVEVILTACGRSVSEDQELRIAKALLPEVTELVRAVVGQEVELDVGEEAADGP